MGSIALENEVGLRRADGSISLTEKLDWPERGGYVGSLLAVRPEPKIDDHFANFSAMGLSMCLRFMTVLPAAAISTALFLSAVTRGQEPAPNGPTVDNTIVTKTAPFLVAAEVNKTNRDYREGDALSLRRGQRGRRFLIRALSAGGWQGLSGLSQ